MHITRRGFDLPEQTQEALGPPALTPHFHMSAGQGGPSRTAGIYPALVAPGLCQLRTLTASAARTLSALPRDSPF